MPTLQYNGQTLTYGHPRELAAVRPTPPTQPLASYAFELGRFQAFVQAIADATDGTVRRRNFMEARGVLVANHMHASIADLPAGTAANFKEQMKMEYTPGSVPGYFSGAASDWLP
jgi:hypothetical protein